jgi:hypothetical protein
MRTVRVYLINASVPVAAAVDVGWQGWKLHWASPEVLQSFPSWACHQLATRAALGMVDKLPDSLQNYDSQT